MTETALHKDIASLLFQNLNVEISSVQEDLIDSGLLDSLKIVQLLVELESHFGLKIPFEDLEIDSFRSVASIAHLMATLCASIEMVSTPGVTLANEAMRLPVAE